MSQEESLDITLNISCPPHTLLFIISPVHPWILYVMGKWALFHLLLYFVVLFHISNAALLDAFVSKEIKDAEGCGSGIYGPTVNITHTQDYESITICFRFLTTSYPHCGGATHEPIRLYDYHNYDKGWLFDYRVYQPISGMSEDGKQAGWLGFRFNETSEGTNTHQVAWRSILYKENLRIYEWQSVCISYGKKTKKILMFHNGEQYLNYAIKEEHIRINYNFLEKLNIGHRFKGSFSDLQVYSEPMNEESLIKWTTCQYDQPGDVYEWDLNKFNLTHDEKIISDIKKVDSKFFCKSKESNEKEVHVFGNGWGTGNPFSYFQGTTLCKRLNGKITMIPKDIAGTEKLDKVLRDYFAKCNVTEQVWLTAWVGGISILGDKYGAEHWYPEKDGLYDFEDPDTGEVLTNEVNKKYFTEREGHTYQKLVHIYVLF